MSGASPSPPRLFVGSENWRVFRTQHHGNKCMQWTSSVVTMNQCDQNDIKQRWYATSTSPTADDPMNILSAYDGKCLTVDSDAQNMVMAECGTGDIAVKQQFYYGQKNQIKHLYDGFANGGKRCLHTRNGPPSTVEVKECKADGSAGHEKQKWLTESRPPAPPPPPLQPPPSLPSATPIGSRLNGDLSNSHFGDAVALSSDGNILAIGAPRHSNERGLVRVFVRSDHADGSTSWTKRGQDLTGEAMNMQFGDAVALSSDGTMLAVGAPLHDYDGGTNTGGVWVYAWTSDGWARRGSVIRTTTSNAGLGNTVSLSSDGAVVAIGGRRHNSYKGTVRVYAWQEDEWNQRGSQLVGATAGDRFGTRVALSSDGSTLAASAYAEKGTQGFSTAGSVRVYTWTDSGVGATASSWTLKGAVIRGDSNEDKLGSGMAMSPDGKIVAAGAPGNAGSMAGRVRVYEWANTAGAGLAWVQRGNTINGKSKGDQFGWSVAMSSDGSRLVVGARSADVGGTDSGSASLFAYTSAGTLSEGSWDQIMADINGYVRVPTRLPLSTLQHCCSSQLCRLRAYPLPQDVPFP